MLWIIVLICAGDLPVDRCTRESARAVQIIRAPEGYAICSAPMSMTLASSALAPGAHEYARVKCGWRAR